MSIDQALTPILSDLGSWGFGFSLSARHSRSFKDIQRRGYGKLKPIHVRFLVTRQLLMLSVYRPYPRASRHVLWHVANGETLVFKIYRPWSLLAVIMWLTCTLQLYTLESRIAYAGWTEENLKDYKGPTPDLVAGLAEHTRKTLGSTYVIGESGTAGPTGGTTKNRIP